MGCDIHLAVEVKNHKGAWQDFNIYQRNEYYDGVDEYEKKFNLVNAFTDRDYELFGALCGVRDRDDNPKLSEPKGIPEDSSKGVSKYSKKYGCDGHSHSWNTLQELIDFNSTKVKRSGLIDPDQQLRVKEGLDPESWCQGCSSDDYIRHEWEVERDIFTNLIQKVRDYMFVLQPYKHIWEGKSDSDIRIVYFFDN